MRILKRVQIDIDSSSHLVHSNEPEFKDCTLVVTNFKGEEQLLVRKFLDLFTNASYALIGKDTQGNYYYEQT